MSSSLVVLALARFTDGCTRSAGLMPEYAGTAISELSSSEEDEGSLERTMAVWDVAPMSLRACVRVRGFLKVKVALLVAGFEVGVVWFLVLVLVVLGLALRRDFWRLVSAMLSRV